MGNLSDLLKNPTSQVETVAALVEALLLDEQTPGGGGNLSGTLTAGKMPIASAAHTVVDGPIDHGVTTPAALTIKNTTAGGIAVDDSGGGGVQVSASGADAVIQLTNSGTGTAGNEIINEGGTGGTLVEDSGGGGITIFDNQAGGGPGVLLKGSSGMRLSTSDDDTGVTDGPIAIIAGAGRSE